MKPDVAADDDRLRAIITSLSEKPYTSIGFLRLLRKHPSIHNRFFSKSEILSAYKRLKHSQALCLAVTQEHLFLRNVRMKYTRSVSGVTPVAVFTKPYPCPGECIFCPSDIRQPKSYLSDEPGAQRAQRNKFDPYLQTYNRLTALANIGHATDKAELIILGGTWSSYPQQYQRWFVKRCFDALNDFDPNTLQKELNITTPSPFHEKHIPAIASPFERDAAIPSDSDMKQYNTKIRSNSYNHRVSCLLNVEKHKGEKTTWEELFASHTTNMRAKTRCVGLSIETRPDEITEKEVMHLRRLGVTKIQLGVQSLSDDVLRKNKRGHGVSQIRKAFELLRLAGFKIMVHMMPNLYGSTPIEDIRDYETLFSDPSYRPDEVKIYPCSLIESAELIHYYKKGLWKPYTDEELKEILTACYKNTPAYTRISRMVRDIPSQYIVDGSTLSNFRQVVEQEMKQRGIEPHEIRSREIRGTPLSKNKFLLDTIVYDTTVSKELFIQYITTNDKLAGFLRLSLPHKPSPVAEISGHAVIRELHIYGQSMSLGERLEKTPQHTGLGASLLIEAKSQIKKYGYTTLSVISAIGTREYYSKNGFSHSLLYQHYHL